MQSPLDEVFALLPETVTGYIDQDRAKKRIRVRADDGRVVTLFFRPAVVADGVAHAAEDLHWFGPPGWSPAKRWVALTSIHIDESINGLVKGTEYVQRAGGFDPIGETTEDHGYDIENFDPTGAYAVMGDRVFGYPLPEEPDVDDVKDT